MVTMQTYMDNSELAQASYGVGLNSNMTQSQYIEVLTKSKFEVEFNNQQATDFANRYVVLATSAEYGIGSINGFDAVLFGEVDAQGNIINKVMAIRGTDGIIDGIVDVVELSGFGTVISQTKSMENFYNALVADNTLGAQEQITLTGHSLGGFIAETFTAKHSDIVDHAYTYNAPGIGGVKGELLKLLGILPDTIDTSKVTNIAASDFLTIIAKFGVMVGDTVEIPGASHSIKDMTDTLKQLMSNGISIDNQWWISLSPEEKARLEALGFIVYDPTDLHYNPNPKDGHPFAPLPPLQRRDPLVLDMNKDGLISTVSLADSTAFFDLTGDGIKEKVGWVQASEGIVAFDKNGNGKIDGIGEVFGTATTSGFAELRTLADSNYDGVIDRRDELYNQLKVWQDANQDGISQASELKTLSQAGVNTIELNVFATNINLNGNLLTEAGRYGDTTGTRSLAADVELTFDSRITTVDTSLIPNYTVHADAASLPKLRGYGVVYNSEIAYNVNDTLRKLAITMSTDITAVANNFETFMAEWTGLNDLLRTAQTKYHLSTAPTLSAIDEKVWIYERFLGQKNFSNAIESSINSTAQGMTTGGSSVAATGLHYQVAAVEQSYNAIANRYRSYFTLQTFYPDVMANAAYDISIDEFVVSDPSAFAANVSAYMNSPTVALEKKLFLADAMNSIQGTFLAFDGASVSSSITDPLLRELVSSIYADTLKAYVYGNHNYTSGNILAVGSKADETINNDMCTILQEMKKKYVNNQNYKNTRSVG
ncbi:MAG: hypothetical protein PHQ22_10625 [Sulfuricurvum sp.]|nr:hypothetical protein [Sulfuricurvum sp.]